jgi:hypothetical protein
MHFFYLIGGKQMTIYPNADIFLLNTFADLHPELHTSLYAQFEKQTKPSDRQGYYGKDSKAYILFLKNRNQPEFMTLIQKGMNVNKRDTYE